MIFRNMNTPFARECWAKVEAAAKCCPEWVRPQIEEAARRERERIVRQTSGLPERRVYP